MKTVTEFVKATVLHIYDDQAYRTQPDKKGESLKGWYESKKAGGGLGQRLFIQGNRQKI